MKTRGKPARSFTTHQRCTVDVWNSPEKLELVSQGDRVVQISVASNRLKTASGLSTGSPRKRINGVHPHLKVTHYLYDTETGKGLDYHDDLTRGIAFVFTNTASEDPETDKPTAIIVHRAGRAAIPTDIQDPSNTGTVAPTKPSPGDRGQSLEASCAGFVQHYYDWYRALLAQDTREPAVMVAIHRKPELLSGELRNLILADRQAELKNRSGYIVGLDFDPVTGGSDYAERYTTQRVTRRGLRYFVEVCGITEGGKQKWRPVTAEVVRWKGRWVFLNFHYRKDNGPGSRDLRNILKELRSDRRAGRV
ncbi:MAG: hypothetical protein ACO1SX_14335 [Actinomycetota bacterium]